MIVFKSKANVIKVGNGYGIRFPNHESMGFKENSRVIMEVDNNGRIIITPYKEKTEVYYKQRHFY